MPDELPEVKPDPSAEELSRQNNPSPLSKSEKEVYDARIKELTEERDDWKKKYEDAVKPKPEPKKHGVLHRFSPL